MTVTSDLHNKLLTIVVKDMFKQILDTGDAADLLVFTESIAVATLLMLEVQGAPFDATFPLLGAGIKERYSDQANPFFNTGPVTNG